MLQSIDTLIAFVVIMTVASLFVTIIVQMASAALSLRGKNLANALALTFQTIDPSLRNSAHQLAAKILSDPLISDSTRTPKNKSESIATTLTPRAAPWTFRTLQGASRLANAVRPEEVYAALKHLAEDANAPDATAAKILAALYVSAEQEEMIAKNLGVFRTIADRITDAPIKKELIEAVEQTPAHLLVQADAARLKFDRWFSTAQDRAQQWFQLHVRGLTIGASFLVAFLFQLDAVEVFHRVSVSPTVRNALVAATQNVAQQGDVILREKGDLVQKIADDWNQTHPDSGLTSTADLRSTAQLEEALRRIATSGAHAISAEAFRADYRQISDAAIKAYFEEKQNLVAQLDQQVNASGFDFIPVGFWRWPTIVPQEADYWTGWYYFWSYWRHSLGMLLFTALLTLGAPYWYNLLKNLTSLRPALAQAIGKEDAAQEKKTPNE